MLLGELENFLQRGDAVLSPIASNRAVRKRQVVTLP